MGSVATVNVPLPAGSGGEVLRSAFDRVVVPAVQEFQPDWLLVSAGFDAHRDDPLASLTLVEGDFATLAGRLSGLVASRRTAFVLEGGYDLGALGRSVLATLAQLVDAEVPSLERRSDDRVGVDVVDRVIGEREAVLA
jgi:acetoin utilization deacetylase AcuC-like enzyme